ncbi:helix-turn-helix domain-containing protein [Sinosporangium siamense]|uniref:PucR family transcriptional regulator n=1 Tax=Sinosporangium siamense TaxID=1367973 RepID=A0A919VA73_9ACTN|nr:helix-turn-helix domain-containing protein [Sinosporangium siamense]GII95102.1 PucR family transcriptional regulator [Sinosporangium siamense]
MLEEVVRQFGADLLEVLVAPQGLGVVVGGVAIRDPFDVEPAAAGALVLLVGVDPDGPEAADVVRGLGGAAAVVVRGTVARPEPLVEAAREAGVALLATRWPLPWTHLYVLLAGSLPETGVADGGRDLGGVPPGDLPALADAVAAALDRPVVMVDTQWRLLAYSAIPGQWSDDLHREMILGRAVPAGSAPPHTRRVVLGDGRARRFDFGEHSRIGVGIRTGAEPRGMLWVLEGRQPLPDERLPLVEEFARLAGVHLGRARAARTAARERFSELTARALDGEATCAELGLDPHAGLAVVAIGALVPMAGEALLDGIATYLEAYRRVPACVLRGETVHCLLSAPAAGVRETVVSLARRAGGRHRLAAGVGGRVTAPGDLPTSLRHAVLALGVVREHPADPPVATVDEVRVRAALAEVHELLNDHPDLLVHDIAALEEWAAVWVEEHGDVRAAAARLGVHPNTLRYRLRKLVESGADLTDPDMRYVAWIRRRFSL